MTINLSSRFNDLVIQIYGKLLTYADQTERIIWIEKSSNYLNKKLPCNNQITRQFLLHFGRSIS